MPSFTPHRGYLYSDPTDPTDVPGAIQTLAEGIDLDIKNIRDTFPSRPAVQVSSTAPMVTGTLGVNTSLTFDRVDFDTGVLTNDLWRQGWLNPGPGVWLVVGRVAVPRQLPSPLPVSLESFLSQSTYVTAANSEISQSTEHVYPAASDMVYDLTVAMAGDAVATDGFRLFFQALLSSGIVSSFTVGARTLSAFRYHG